MAIQEDQRNQEQPGDVSTGVLDAFVNYAEVESRENPLVENIVNALREQKFSVHFFRTDIRAGDRLFEIEDEQMHRARAMIVMLGNHGWGTTHRKLTMQARELGKRIIPVVVGEVEPEAAAELDGLFSSRLYIDARQPGGISRIAQELRRSPAPQFDTLITNLTDGSEGERSRALQQAVNFPAPERQILAERLREDIQRRFSGLVDREGASRDPAKLVSARSWLLSALIWTRQQDPATRDVLLRHVNPRTESASAVRFWTLAGLFQTEAAVLPQALELVRSDEADEVRMLGLAIGNLNEATVTEFRRRLASSSFGTVWSILRVLRVIPIPELAEDLCVQLDRDTKEGSLSYDAFYALLLPEMRQAAAPILREKLGLDRLIDLMLDVGRTSDPIALERFSVVLRAFPEEEVEDAFAKRRADTLYPAPTIALRRFFRQQIEDRPDEVNRTPVRANYHADTANYNPEHDDLGVGRDVAALAAVMLDRNVQPPLAIGLFGNWGTGKSYFIGALQAEVRNLTTKEQPSPYHTRVVSIVFNAWHYVDSNLWASLVNHILDSLAAHVAAVPSATELRKILDDKMKSQRAIIAEAEQSKQEIEKQVGQTKAVLLDHQAARQQKEIELRKVQLSDLAAVLGRDSELAKVVKKAQASIGMTEATQSAAALSAAFADALSLQGRVSSMLRVLVDEKNGKLMALFIGLILIVPPFLYWAIGNLDHALSKIAAVVSTGAVLITGAATLIRTTVSKAGAVWQLIENAKRQLDEQIARKKFDPTDKEIELEKAITDLRDKEQEAGSLISTAVAKLAELDSELTALNRSQSFSHFLVERNKSDDYRKHLGLISQIRRDFEDMTTRLEASSSQPDGVERIILYIDDLDRCPPKMVVEVLQAVHLLLAFKLFVVVVGVDPRWLMHSLAKNYAPLHDDGEDSVSGNGRKNNELWRTTPQNYLEKIFQIPFSLRPMNSTGYSALIKRLLAPTAGEPESHVKPGEYQQAGAVSALDAKTKTKSDEIHEIDGQQGTSTIDRTNNPTNTVKKPVISERVLRITPAEVQYAALLFELIPTPRAAKRFANIYRLLKTMVPESDLDDYEDASNTGGEFKVPMLLLALMISAPDRAPMLLAALQAEATGRADMIERLQVLFDGEDMKAQGKLLREVLEKASIPGAARLFGRWLPRVRRFSFDFG